MADYSSCLDRSRLVQVLCDLVRIPSVNPGFPGGTGEGLLASYVRAFFEGLGLPCGFQPVEEGRGNMIGILPGAGPMNLLLEAHMDTVQTEGMTIPPFSAMLKNGRVYGRGACDTKASLAAMLLAVESLHRAGLVPPAQVFLAAVVDEEITYKGVSRLAERIESDEIRFQAAVVGEPTSLDLIAAHKGCVRFHVDVLGKACHSSEPSGGVNAISGMAEVIRYLREYESLAYPALTHPLTGPPTHCISQIQGGVAPNTVPDRCRITVDRRTVPGEEAEAAHQAMKAGLLALQEAVPGLQLAIGEPFLIDYAMETPLEEPVVARLLASARKFVPEVSVRGAAYCSDASKLSRAGVPSVVFGPGSIEQAHTPDEWVEVEQVAAAAVILMDFIMNWMGIAP